VYGSSIAGPIWKQSMTAALKGVEATRFHSVDQSRFGGCSDHCAPKPKKKKSDDNRFDFGDRFDRDDDRGDDRGGDRGDFDWLDNPLLNDD
jgi:hypothetical protein